MVLGRVRSSEFVPRRPEPELIGAADHAGPRLVINGRFLGQRLTGVQRFASEIVRALDTLLAARPPHRTGWVELHHPKGCVPPKDLQTIRPRQVGASTGHLWEQAELAMSARHATLLSLGNTGPVLHGRQIVVIHDASVLVHPENFTFAFRSAYRALYALLAKVAVHTLTVSSFSASELRRHLRPQRGEIAVVPNAADHFARVSADPSILERHGLDGTEFVLAIASASRTKNTGVIPAALDRIDRPRPKLVWVGARNTRIFRESVMPDTADAVWLQGVTDAELKALYERALCLVFPSTYEGFGLPPLEAMQCGCPVIASEIGAVREVCADAVLYFSPRDADALAACIQQIQQLPGLRDELILAGRERAAQFTWEKSSQRLLEIVQEVMER